MENVRTGSAVFATAKRTGGKCGIRMSYIRGQFSCYQQAREAFLISKRRTIDPNGLISSKNCTRVQFIIYNHFSSLFFGYSSHLNSNLL